MSRRVVMAQDKTQYQKSGGIAVVKDSKATTDVVIPDVPLPVHEYAAKELVEHVRKATGVELKVVKESQAARQGNHIFVGPVKALTNIGLLPPPPPFETVTIPHESITIGGAPVRRVKEPTGEFAVADSPTPITGEENKKSIDIVLDLGAPREIAAISLVNRSDVPTNYNIGEARIEVGTTDDGKTFDQVLTTGLLEPRTNEAGARRFLKLGDESKAAAKVRYVRVRVLSSLWGQFGSNANAVSIHWHSLGIAPPVPTIAGADKLRRLNSLTPNAFIIRSKDSSLFLAGRDEDGPPLQDNINAGTLFAVYEWLERQVGARWLWPGELGTQVVKVKSLAGGTWHLEEKSPLIHTRLRTGFGQPLWDDQNAYVRYQNETTIWLRRHRFDRDVSLEYPHGFTDYWERYGAAHPEYFAMRPDGKRAPYDEHVDLVQMCVSNPGLHKQIIENWLEQKRIDPARPWINGTENDKRAEDPACTCPVCTSWDVPGSNTLADRYAKFWMALQAEGQKHDPNATVIGLAYAGYTFPPVATKLNERVIVGIVPATVYPRDENSKKSYEELWNGWAKTGARLFLRPNYFLEGYCMPYIFAEQFGEDFKFAINHNMIATDFDSLTGMWGAQGPNLYLLARLHDDPSLEVKTALDEYYNGFGPAAKQVRAYFDYWKNVTLKMDNNWYKTAEGGWSTLSYSGDRLYTPDKFAAAAKLMEAAKKAASSDAEASKQVNYLGLWLENARLSMRTLAAFHASQRDEKNQTLTDALAAAKNEMEAYRKKNADEMLLNIGFVHQIEMWAGWRPRPDWMPR